MPTTTFEAFKAELTALNGLVGAIRHKTVRDEALRERFRILFRTWTWTVRPAIAPLVQTEQGSLKLEAELEALAKLASKYKRVADYRKRLNRAITLANDLVLLLPPTQTSEPHTLASSRDDLFLPDIPDLPARLVPNALLGWRSQIGAFVGKYPFDRSVFVMIRYRQRNVGLVGEVKGILSDQGYKGILASDHKVTDDLYNPVACLLCCSKGIAVFDEPESAQEFTPNVAYELGMLHLLGRDCLILKHETLKALPTDVLMKLYSEYRTVSDVKSHIADWLKPSDLDS